MAVCSVTVVVASVLAFAVVLTNGLKCYMCGQYNEGVGSITPCLNYSEKYAHLYLKECSRPSERYCVVSTIRLQLLLFMVTFFGSHFGLQELHQIVCWLAAHLPDRPAFLAKKLTDPLVGN